MRILSTALVMVATFGLQAAPVSDTIFHAALSPQSALEIAHLQIRIMAEILPLTRQVPQVFPEDETPEMKVPTRLERQGVPGLVHSPWYYLIGRIAGSGRIEPVSPVPPVYKPTPLSHSLLKSPPIQRTTKGRPFQEDFQPSMQTRWLSSRMASEDIQNYLASFGAFLQEVFARPDASRQFQTIDTVLRGLIKKEREYLRQFGGHTDDAGAILRLNILDTMLKQLDAAAKKTANRTNPAHTST